MAKPRSSGVYHSTGQRTPTSEAALPAPTGALTGILSGPGRGRRGTIRSRRTGLKVRSQRSAYLFMTPWFIGIVVLTAGPLIASLLLSFTNFNLLSAPRFIGASNYMEMFTADPRFWHSIRVTFEYVILTVPLQLAFALGLAVLLNRQTRGLGWYRAAFYLPSLLGGSVAIAVVWRQVFDTHGIFNAFLGFFGIQGQGWVSTPSTALFTLVALHIWQFGSPMIIFLAGLKGVPSELHDAAATDGAGPWRRFWFVTFPLITPVLFFNLVLQIIQAFQAFTPAYVVSGGTGGPADSTLFYTLYLYIEGFTNFRMGYASAMAWVLLAIIAIFTGLNFFFSRFWVFYPDDDR